MATQKDVFYSLIGAVLALSSALQELIIQNPGMITDQYLKEHKEYADRIRQALKELDELGDK